MKQFWYGIYVSWSYFGMWSTFHEAILVCDIAEDLKISEGRVLAILHEHLSMRKLCSKWVQRLLRVDQKQQRVDDSERCL